MNEAALDALKATRRYVTSNEWQKYGDELRWYLQMLVWCRRLRVLRETARLK